jgi:sugar lactone lactonase YvrE
MRLPRFHPSSKRIPTRAGVVVAGMVLLAGVVAPTAAGASGSTLHVLAGVHGQYEESDRCATGQAVKALLNLPSAVASFGGNVYVADAGDSCVLEIQANGTIAPVAGTGKPGFNGNGIPAAQAQLSSPEGLAFDAAGDLFIADSGNNRIREITTNGIIKEIAGRSQFGFSGDGGPAVQARLNFPLGVAVDTAGDVVFSDTQNERVREVTPDGIMHTIAGTGVMGFNGDKIPATQAELSTPAGVAFGPRGNLYIGDVGNNRVRSIDISGVIHTAAGNGDLGGYNPNNNVADETPLFNPYSVAADAAGDLFIADSTNCLVREVTPNGLISNVVGEAPSATNGPKCGFVGDGLPPTQSRLNRPYGIAVTATGTLLIADTFNQVVRSY